MSPIAHNGFQQGVQAFTCIPQPPFDGAEGTPGFNGHLRHAHIEKVLHHDHSALSGRQAPDGSEDRPADFFPLQQLLGVRRWIREPFCELLGGVVQLFVQREAAGLLFSKFERIVHHYLEEPWRKWAPVIKLVDTELKGIVEWLIDTDPSKKSKLYPYDLVSYDSSFFNIITGSKEKNK